MADKKMFNISAVSTTGRDSYRRAGIGFGKEPVNVEVNEDQLKKLEGDKYIKIISKEEAKDSKAGK